MDEYGVAGINYWKEISTAVQPALQGMQEQLLLMHNSAEFAEIAEFLKELPSPESFVYLSLIKTYDSIREKLPLLNAPCFVVDFVSAAIFEKQSTEHCRYKKMPTSLYTMLDTVEEVVRGKQPSFLVMDSLSQFIDICLKPGDMRSVYTLFEKLKELHGRLHTRFILLYDYNLSRKLEAPPRAHVKDIIRMEVMTEKIRWEG